MNKTIRGDIMGYIVSAPLPVYLPTHIIEDYLIRKSWLSRAVDELVAEGKIDLKTAEDAKIRTARALAGAIRIDGRL